jgi:mannose-1-phosphate guanylyltransferase
MTGKRDGNLYAVIMAGGIGSRFWPLSRRRSPKQFLPIISEKSMIEETALRLNPDIPGDCIFTIANREQTETIARLLPDVPRSNLLVEPEGKNTAPSLILATALVFLQNPEAVVAALPADHLILDSSRFRRKLLAAAEAAAAGDYLVTFGIPPAYPATGYGYIHYSTEKAHTAHEEAFFNVRSFKEKPDYEEACRFVDSGEYAWNSGMFVWRARVFADKLKTHAPSFYRFWEAILAAGGESEGVAKAFAAVPALSIDYALMEKASGVLMCRGDFGWSDVGAWSALRDIWTKDDRGNTLRGEGLALDSGNCLVYNPGRMTALVGVNNLIVVSTDDALLICSGDQDQKVKTIVDILGKKGRDDFL